MIQMLTATNIHVPAYSDFDDDEEKEKKRQQRLKEIELVLHKGQDPDMKYLFSFKGDILFKNEKYVVNCLDWNPYNQDLLAAAYGSSDIDSKKEVTLLTPKDLFHMRDGDKYFTWSPDSKWLLVDWSKTLSNSEVLLIAADGSKRINLPHIEQP